MQKNTSLVDYYAKRAGEYERLYEKPERQADLAALRQFCARMLAGQNVLEIACGTGYWTQTASQTARSILATDINAEMLEIARSKEYECDVEFARADAFNLESLSHNGFTAGMAMAWWSHLRKSEIDRFLDGYHRLFRPGALMVYMDNRFVPGSNLPICRTDEEGNTYQLRSLKDGTTHEVLKNFPSEIELRKLLAGKVMDFNWKQLPYYWVLTYKLA